MYQNKLNLNCGQGQCEQMQEVDAQLEALERHKKLIREHREKETKLRERKLINYSKYFF